MKMRLYTLLILAVGCIAGKAVAFTASDSKPDAEMKKLINDVCKNVVMCMKEEIRKDEGELSPQMTAMVDKMSTKTCKVFEQYNEFVEYSTVTVDDVKACYKEMATAECGRLDNQSNIASCKIIEDKLDKM